MNRIVDFPPQNHPPAGPGQAPPRHRPADAAAHDDLRRINAVLDPSWNHRCIVILVAVGFAVLTSGAGLVLGLPLICAQLLGGCTLPSLLHGHRPVFRGVERLRCFWPQLARAAGWALAALVLGVAIAPPFLLLLLPALWHASRFVWYWLAPGARRYVVIGESLSSRVGHVLIIGGSVWNHRPDICLTPGDLLDARYLSPIPHRLVGDSWIQLRYRRAGEEHELRLHAPCAPERLRNIATFLNTHFVEHLFTRRAE